MIFVTTINDPLRPESRKEYTVRGPATIEECAPDWFNIGNGAHSLFANGEWTDDLGRVMGDGDSLQFVESYAGTGAELLLWAIFAIGTGAIARRLMAIPEQESAGDDSYGFQGWQNTYLEGSAVPMVYGYTRVAPPVIAQSIESAWSAWTLGRQERMRLLMAVSDGPIYGFGDMVGEVASDTDLAALPAITDPLNNTPSHTRMGLQINGQDAANFDEVISSWRTGELNQDPPYGWEDTSVDVTIDQELPEVTGIDGATKPPGVYTAGNEITAADGDFASYTMADVADRAELTFDMVRGLYKQDSSGALLPSTASFRVQFWPVDSGGTRTGDTLILPEFHFTDAKSTQQTVTVPLDLYDPATYTAPIPQGYISCGSGSSYCEITTPDPQNFPDLYAFPSAMKFSWVSWARVPSSESIVGNVVLLRSHKGSFSYSPSFPYPVIASVDSTAHQGIEIALVSEISTGAVDSVHIAVRGWSGLNRSTWISPSIGTEPEIIGQWKHIGVTWDGANPAFYVDGQPLSGTTVTSSGTGAGPSFHVEQPVSVGVLGTVDVSDWMLIDGVDGGLEQSHYGKYTKFGKHLSAVSGDQIGLRMASHFSETVASGKIENLRFPASTTLGECFEIVGTPLNATPQTDAAVYSEESGIVLEGRYKIQAFRSNPVLDDPLTEVNAAAWKLLKLIEDEDFERPGLATLSVDILADDQVSGSRPTVTALCAGRTVEIWDGYDEDYPLFTRAWTRNPAWICLDLLTNEESGMGALYDKRKNIDLQAFKDWADYCDEGVEDAAGTPTFYKANAASATATHLNGTVTFFVGILDGSGASTGYSIPTTWKVGHTIRIKTCSDATFLTTSSDAIRLPIYDIHYDSDTTAPDGYQHWAVVSVDWTADLDLPTGTNETGTAVGFEARHEFDGVFDSKQAAGWDEIQVPMRTARAFPVRFGDTLSVFVDKARPPVAMFTMANIIEGTFELGWSGIDDRPNAVEIEYQDRNHDFDAEMLSMAHPSVASSDDVTAERRERIKVRGVTRRSQIMRDAMYRLNQHNLLRRSCSFAVGTDSVGLVPGDRIRVAHDVPYYGISGRVYSDVTTATELVLDRDVVLEFGSTYEVEVRSTSGLGASNAELRETVAIDASEIPGSGSTTISAGTSITLASPGFQTFSPERGDMYSFGETGETAEDFAVVSVSLDPSTMIRKVEAIEYNADTYLDNEWGAIPVDPIDDIDPPQPAGGTPKIKRIGDGLNGGVGTATETTWRNADGKPVAGVKIVMPPFSQEGLGGGTDIWAADMDNGSVPVPVKVAHAEPGQKDVEISGAKLVAGVNYRFYLQRRSRSGAARPPQASPSIPLYVSGNVPVPSAPTVSAPHTRGDNAVYGIEFPDGQRPEGVEVRVGGWILGQKLAADLRDGELVSDQWVKGPVNSEGQAALTNYVRSLLPNGQVSDAATFVVGTTAPLGGSELSATAHEDAWASGTLDGLQIDSSTSPPHLKFTGSGLTGTFTTPTLDMSTAKRYFVEVAAQCWQDDGETFASVGGTYGSRKNLNRTYEGATGGPGVKLSKLEVQWTPSTSGTPSADYTAFRPGKAHFRSAKFRVKITRPDSGWDCRLERFGVRITSLPDFEPGDLDAGTF